MKIRPVDRRVYFMPNNMLVNNPHMGFTTFNSFNGDKLRIVDNGIGFLSEEGKDINYQAFNGNLSNGAYPDTSLAYLRIYWKYFEPEQGQYRFDILDKALETAAQRNQKLMFRLMPYGSMENEDVPDWYRDQFHEKHRGFNDYYVPQNDAFYDLFPAAVKAIGARYDHDRRMDSVDVGIIGPWGEGKGTDDLPIERRNRLIDAYTQGFPETPLMGLIVSPDAILYANQARPVGFRCDCLGDMGGRWSDPLSQHSHMLEVYPAKISSLKDLWKKAPVSFEACWYIYHWMDMKWDIDYIIEQSLKWHISSFNGKSAPVPKEWKSNVDDWCRKMGYRFALRSFEYPSEAEPGDVLRIAFWMENRGVAPIYYLYPLVLRMIRQGVPVVTENGKPIFDEQQITLDTDCRTWLPGDTIWNGEIRLPESMNKGNYSLKIALVDPVTRQPAIKMPITASNDDAWTDLGKIQII